MRARRAAHSGLAPRSGALMDSLPDRKGDSGPERDGAVPAVVKNRDQTECIEQLHRDPGRCAHRELCADSSRDGELDRFGVSGSDSVIPLGTRNVRIVAPQLGLDRVPAEGIRQIGRTPDFEGNGWPREQVEEADAAQGARFRQRRQFNVVELQISVERVDDIVRKNADASALLNIGAAKTNSEVGDYRNSHRSAQGYARA